MTAPVPAPAPDAQFLIGRLRELGFFNYYWNATDEWVSDFYVCEIEDAQQANIVEEKGFINIWSKVTEGENIVSKRVKKREFLSLDLSMNIHESQKSAQSSMETGIWFVSSG